MTFEYLAIMQSSEVVGTMPNKSYAIQLGLSSITHIFKLAFINTKNLSTTETYYQKGIYCYIEYLEQFNKLSVPQTLDYADAIGFIYDKTLSDFNANGSSSVFTNILSVSQTHQAQGDDFAECLVILDQVGTLASTLLWLSNEQLTLLDQMDIVETQLFDFLQFASTPNVLEPAFLFLDTLQTHLTEIGSKEYIEILHCLKKRLNSKGPHKSTSSETSKFVRDNCLLLVANYSGKTVKYMADQEGWRKPGEDLVKTIWN